MDKRSRERHQQHRLKRVDESHLTNVTPFYKGHRLHQCVGHCNWRGWVAPNEHPAKGV